MMKKNIPGLLLIGVLLFSVYFLFIKKDREPALKTARQKEAIGDTKKACALYAEAVYTLIPSASFPDVAHSKFVEPEQYLKEVEQYLSPLSENNIGKKKEITDATAGLVRCNHTEKGVVRLKKRAQTPFSRKTYYDEWVHSFFAPNANISPSHTSLAEGNFFRNLSLVVLSCGKNYSYECMLLNTATLQASKCFLPAENSVRFYALPGEYLLIVRSTVTFQNGDIWRSDFVALPLSIPENASLIESELQTRLPRR